MAESYRQAVKLDGERFCTTFHPYDLGIIGVISQALIPGIAKATQTLKYTSGKEVEKDLSAWPERYGITAELYKLNVSVITTSSQNLKRQVDMPPGLLGSFRQVQISCGYSTKRNPVR